METSKDTKPVRPSEDLDWEKLAFYARVELKKVLGDEFDENAEMRVEQFPGGHSNLTYLLRFREQEFVLRCPPFGKLPPRAHDMAREFRVLEKIFPVYALAPRPFVLCEDAEIVGSTFYIMERRKGIVIRTREPEEIKKNPEKRRKISEAMIGALAELHNIDIEKNHLAALGKPQGFVTRQIAGWTKRWHGSKTGEIAEMDRLAQWLGENIPPECAKPALVHGDFKLDNAMLDPLKAERIVGVFDWEMSAVGDPLIDLGILICYWIHWAKIVKYSNVESLEAVTLNGGWFSREEILESYGEKTGIDLENFAFFEIFAVFKLAVVLQQIFYRYHTGQTDDPRFAHLDKSVKSLAQIAVNLLDGK